MKRLGVIMYLLLFVLQGIMPVYAQPLIEATPTPGFYYAMPKRAEGLFLKEINGSDIKGTQETDPAMMKMSSGFINATTFWMELPKEVAQTSQEQNLLVGSTLGFGKGVVMGLVRGTSGVVDAATLGMTPAKKPIMEPDYKVKNPNQGFKVSLLEW